MEFKRDEHFNKSDLKAMGFTDKMISTLLPNPTERPNPYYKKGASVKLWPKTVVEEVMATEEYAAEREKVDRRSKASKKAVETKRAKTEAMVDDAISKIHVNGSRSCNTYEKALAAGVRHKEEHEGGYLDSIPDVQTQERWAVNYIRHELTEYDESLYNFKGKVGKNEAYQRYKSAVLDAIAAKYPFLADECERQKVPRSIREEAALKECQSLVVLG